MQISKKMHSAIKTATETKSVILKEIEIDICDERGSKTEIKFKIKTTTELEGSIKMRTNLQEK